MPAPFRPDYERKTIPTVPMIVISFVSFLDNFCYTLVNPNIPYMCKVYFPEVQFIECLFCSFLIRNWVFILDGLLLLILLVVSQEISFGVGLPIAMVVACRLLLVSSVSL